MTEKITAPCREVCDIQLYPRAAAMFAIVRPYLARALEGSAAFGTVEIIVNVNKDAVIGVETRQSVRMRPDKILIECGALGGEQ